MLGLLSIKIIENIHLITIDYCKYFDVYNYEFLLYLI